MCMSNCLGQLIALRTVGSSLETERRNLIIRRCHHVLAAGPSAVGRCLWDPRVLGCSRLASACGVPRHGFACWWTPNTVHSTHVWLPLVMRSQVGRRRIVDLNCVSACISTAWNQLRRPYLRNWSHIERRRLMLVLPTSHLLEKCQHPAAVAANSHQQVRNYQGEKSLASRL
jgi:hypothetical protein